MPKFSFIPRQEKFFELFEGSARNMVQAARKLKEMVDNGVFGDVPERNSFGCYTLFRQFPGRFEEIKSETTQSK